MTRVVQAPNPLKTENKIFLAGSIEMGAAENWQDRIIDSLKDIDNLLLLNPRRDNWDSSWEQSINNTKFYEQVSWELAALDSADVIILYFDPNTKSPISLLELGLYANSRKLIVCCPEGFWRKGNVDIVCEKYGIFVFNDLENFIETIVFEIEELL